MEQSIAPSPEPVEPTSAEEQTPAAELPESPPVVARPEDLGSPAQPIPESVVAEWQRLVEERAIVEVNVLERVRGGFHVRYGEFLAFLPTPLATAKRYPFESELRELLGQNVHVVCHELRKGEDGSVLLIVSRRHFLEDLALERLRVGQVVEGVVTRLTTSGAFVDVGGIEGLIPTAELDHVPTAPNKVFSIGDHVTVQVIGIDTAKRQVRLSRKALLPSPWRGIEERYPVGSRVRGIVRRVVPKAALVQVEPGIDGIVPVEELSWTQQVPHPAHVLSAGQEAEFVVLEVSEAKKRLVLSLRRTHPNPWETAATEYPVGSRVSVVVRRLSERAAHVELPNGLPGIIPAAELTWRRSRLLPSQVLQLGQQVEAVVIQAEPERYLIVLSLRQAQPNPWEHAEARFPVGSRVQGIVRQVLPRTAIVEVAEDIEGFIPLGELSWTRRFVHAAEALRAGQEVECVVTEISAAEQRLVLSLRQAQPNPWPELVERYPVGSEWEATFVQQQQTGSLVRLDGEIDAFMPRSTYAPVLRSRREPWKPGERLRVRVVEVNPDQHSLIVAPLLERVAPTAAPPKLPAQRPLRQRTAPQAPIAESSSHRKAPPRREERRTGVTLADLLPEEVREKLLQGSSS